MRKRGQIALFIALGIVILVGVSLYLYFSSEQTLDASSAYQDAASKIPLQLQPIQTFVEECVSSVGRGAVTTLGLQGGHIFAIDPVLSTNYTDMAYGFYDDRNILPSIDEMQGELERYVSVTLPDCTANFTAFGGAEITAGKAEVAARIAPGKVIFRIDYPIDARMNNVEGRVEKFYEEVPVDLLGIVDIANAIIDKLVEDPHNLDMTFLTTFDIQSQVEPHDGENIVIVLTDDDQPTVDGEYVFGFANHFIRNKKPQLDLEREYTLRDDVPFRLIVGAIDDDEELVFSDDTSRFRITPDGIIEFTPRITGEFYATIRVEDPHGLTDERRVKFIVQE